MMGPVWANWTVLNPRWPDSWPAKNQPVYIFCVTVDAEGQPQRILGPIKSVIVPTEEGMKTVMDNAVFLCGKDVVVLWQPVPPRPRLPKSWRLLQNVRCENHSCEYYDNSYCLDGPEGCPHGIPSQEFSAIF